ncbi:MarR family winged helix-turn-helix transcriptional regulator [uncultured Friedmanniella sp.]|uniref:MarR family winged helix-turn-helix transcriptional regulator n=1 Tax=uncultured Friedmanniella sp. TaxID=335381 RepID=UPI0035C9C257
MDTTDDAVQSLRSLILAAERYRAVLAAHVGLGVTEAQAVSSLSVHGGRGQKELAVDLGLTSGAATALVDRLEKQGIAQRSPHAWDRRRTIVRLTARGHQVVEESRVWLSALFNDATEDELERLAPLLRGVADRLGDRCREIEASDGWSYRRA